MEDAPPGFQVDENDCHAKEHSNISEHGYLDKQSNLYAESGAIDVQKLEFTNMELIQTQADIIRILEKSWHHSESKVQKMARKLSDLKAHTSHLETQLADATNQHQLAVEEIALLQERNKAMLAKLIETKRTKREGSEPVSITDGDYDFSSSQEIVVSDDDDDADIRCVIDFGSEEEVLRARSEIEELKARLAAAPNDDSIDDLSYDESAVSLFEGDDSGTLSEPNEKENSDQWETSSSATVEKVVYDEEETKVDFRDQGKANFVFKTFDEYENDACVISRISELETKLTDTLELLNQANAENVFITEGYQDFLNDSLEALKRSEDEAEKLRHELEVIKPHLERHVQTGNMAWEKYHEAKCQIKKLEALLAKTTKQRNLAKKETCLLQKHYREILDVLYESQTLDQEFEAPKDLAVSLNAFQDGSAKALLQTVSKADETKSRPKVASATKNNRETFDATPGIILNDAKIVKILESQISELDSKLSDTLNALAKAENENKNLEGGYKDFLEDALDSLKRSEDEAEELRYELEDVKHQLKVTSSNLAVEKLKRELQETKNKLNENAELLKLTQKTLDTAKDELKVHQVMLWKSSSSIVAAKAILTSISAVCGTDEMSYLPRKISAFLKRIGFVNMTDADALLDKYMSRFGSTDLNIVQENFWAMEKKLEQIHHEMAAMKTEALNIKECFPLEHEADFDSRPEGDEEIEGVYFADLKQQIKNLIVARDLVIENLQNELAESKENSKNTREMLQNAQKALDLAEAKVAAQSAEVLIHISKVVEAETIFKTLTSISGVEEICDLPKELSMFVERLGFSTFFEAANFLENFVSQQGTSDLKFILESFREIESKLLKAREELAFEKSQGSKIVRSVELSNETSKNEYENLTTDYKQVIAARDSLQSELDSVQKLLSDRTLQVLELQKYLKSSENVRQYLELAIEQREAEIGVLSDQMKELESHSSQKLTDLSVQLALSRKKIDELQDLLDMVGAAKHSKTEGSTEFSAIKSSAKAKILGMINATNIYRQDDNSTNIPSNDAALSDVDIHDGEETKCKDERVAEDPSTEIEIETNQIYSAGRIKRIRNVFKTDCY
jgi:hypothetical protein